MNVRFFLTAGVGAWVRFLYLRRFARKYLLRRRGMLVLDAGFGGGEYLGWLALRLPEASLFGYDTSTGNTYSSNLERARKNADSTNVRLAIKDLKVLDDRSVFDVVYSIDVLEHIAGNEAVIRNIFDALKEEGLFYRPTVLPARY